MGLETPSVSKAALMQAMALRLEVETFSLEYLKSDSLFGGGVVGRLLVVKERSVWLDISSRFFKICIETYIIM